MFQVVKSKFGIQNFQGIPFENFPDQAQTFRNNWTSIWKNFNTNIKVQMKKNPDNPVLLEKIRKLREKKMICAHEYPGLMAQFSSHPPRLPKKPPYVQCSKSNQSVFLIFKCKQSSPLKFKVWNF